MKIFVSANVRYWEDSSVDGKEDIEGYLIPCREDEFWCPTIDTKTGKILNWNIGTTANIHYKVADDYSHIIKDGKKVIENIQDEYVPSFMCPKENGYGDYIIMDIDENGFIKDFDFGDYL